ncbi:Uncharacterised protein [Klebsiella quasipneumoniae]|nr:Uncharacterised protein [Klebsiella quasipneumoniae]SLX35618.1 Uncharacterised protein [Klebsiella quasipneumoniae]SLX41350.1 Uncharacterised protein [Klebsiella quasipneumoniae]SLX43328.1 Uncharacterised protein [Klebsiella quasipneumoniae]SLX57962.1 Uncharacterised protein [Klebsiella quasipneumoniae]
MGKLRYFSIEAFEVGYYNFKLVPSSALMYAFQRQIERA